MSTTRHNPGLASTPEATQVSAIRTLGAAMVLTLLGQLLLGMANALWLQLPASGSGWSAGASSGLLMAHLALGLALLVLAVWILISAVHHHDRNWLLATGFGVVGIVVAFGSGIAFLSQPSSNGASFLMTVGTAVAIAAYALGLYQAPAAAKG